MDLQFPTVPDWDARPDDTWANDEELRVSEKKRTIIGADYNLNSPLLDWRVANLTEALINKAKASGNGFFANELRQLRNLCSDVGYSPTRLKNTDIHHTLIPTLIYTTPNILNLNLGSRYMALWDGVIEVLQSMDKAILGHHTSYENKDVLDHLVGAAKGDHATKQELRSFLVYHFLTCAMNSRTDKHLIGLFKDVFRQGEVEVEGPGPSFKVYDNKGRLVLFGSAHHVIFPTWDVLVDKNFILMLKDVALGRLMAMCAVVGRDPEKPGLKCRAQLRDLYMQGDVLLERHGNKAYRAIKLLEAECTSRWNELGHRHRPLIPISNGLRDHLDSTAKELRETLGIDARMFREVVQREDDPWIIAQMYGAYRHWGHPYIDSLVGLKKLHDRVTRDLVIDEAFAEQLGSEMAFLVLQDRFQKEKKWYCTSRGLPEASPLKRCIDEGVWPTSKVIRDFGDNWHKLDLIPCFDIPDEIEPADLFSDKAHSMPRSKVLEHIVTTPNKPIPGLRVIQTLISEDVPSVKDFLEDVNRNGLSEEDLVIGLKPKERELKEEGRFFSLMGWKLRLYFVITEYLIKKLFVPLFKGLTMADDLNTVTKKMIAATEGQGLLDYSKVYIANSLDYEKWNNNQRYESNQHVFRVMGRFIGLPEIFALTHKFFQRSLVYYCDRPDLMRYERGSLSNVSEDTPVCWQGQQGGFEGLRQKGWSIVNYLILRREILLRNTGTLILAQGDNQIIIPKYKIVNKLDETGIRMELKNIWDNNASLMDRIRASTSSLGLTINKDEVVTSAELLVYGKVPIYRGVVIPLETKRWARVSSVTNDQLPSLATAVSSTVTSALAVCQHTDNPVYTMWHYGKVGCLVLTINTYFNPLTGADPFKFKRLDLAAKKKLAVRTLFKDPSVGGVCGSNLFRFLLSRFPDPVCESLSWWKLIYSNTVSCDLKEVALEAGCPAIGKVSSETWSRLLEDPTSLNIPSTLSSNTLIKEQIYEGLCQKANDGTILNRRLRESVLYNDNHKAAFVEWLFTIKPTFPRFLSEFYTSTYFRLTEGIISTFQNSRTIRTVFSTEFTEHVNDVIIKSELSAIKLLLNPKLGKPLTNVWSCSAAHADQLRLLSWGRTIEGSTIPHPGEMLVECKCESCMTPHIVAKKTSIEQANTWTRGPLTPYLGSKTSENTSVLQPWEKNIEIPLLRQACQLRRAIDWLMDPNDNLAKSIYNNIQSMTGISLEEEDNQVLRTGCGKHRLRSARVSNEGAPACGYPPLMYVAVTTDSLGEINQANHDFMYQSLICWAGVVSTLRDNSLRLSDTTHFHIRDPQCVREITEDKLSVDTEFRFPDVSASVKRMLSCEMVVKTSTRHTTPLPSRWDDTTDQDKSWHIGRAQGFLWALSVFDGSTDELKDALFPVSITNKVCVWEYMHGLHRGLMLGSTFPPLFARYGSLDTKASLRFQGAYWNAVGQALEVSKLPDLLWNTRFAKFAAHYGASTIKSYPARKDELVSTLRQWLVSRIQEDFSDPAGWLPTPVVVFAEMDSDYVINMFRVAEKTLHVFSKQRLGTKDLRAISYARMMVRLLMAQKHERISPEDNRKLQKEIRGAALPAISLVSSEARRAASDIAAISCQADPNEDAPKLRECGISVEVVPLEYVPLDTDTGPYSYITHLPSPRIRNPIVSGVRLVQLSTGAHYKFRDLLCHVKVDGDGVFCGDGSGGMGACFLRMFPHRRAIFNSLLTLEGESMKGMAPPGPGAYTASGISVTCRCVNHATCYQEPSDLRDLSTWDNIIALSRKFKLRIGVLCCDADAWDESSVRNIEAGFLYGCEKLLRKQVGVAIFKTFWHHIKNPNSIAHLMGTMFDTVWACFPYTQGANTSEVYLVGQGIHPVQTTHKAVVSEETLLRVYSGLKSTRTYKEEFVRARSMSFELMTNGMEPRIPYTDATTIMELVISLGVKSGLALEVANMILESAWNLVHPESLLRVLIFLLTRDTVDIESEVTDHLLIPSSSQLQRSVAVVYGLWFGTSIVTGNYGWYDKPIINYQKPTTVYFEATHVGPRKFMRWGFGPGKFTKTVDHGERVGVTQALIRLLVSVYRGRWEHRNPRPSDTKSVNTMLQHYSRRITCKRVEDQTPVLLSPARGKVPICYVLEAPDE
ncbi:polymerase [New Minto virus]|uniref:Replicase n=2 Tax=New Minto virus TaxID=1272952 RepID=A0A0D3R177_9RHAB|nr:polymerase [New Minto virus]AJR28474.1 polymerase [New Minto virus]